jgi:hypothetical protein
MPLLDALRLADADLDTAAEILAKTAMHVQRHGPLVKAGDGLLDSLRTSPAMPQNWNLSRLTEPLRQGYEAMSPESKSMLTNTAVGAGVGGLGTAAVSAVQGRKKRQVLNSALAGALGGAGLGAAGTYLAQGNHGQQIETNDEAYKLYKNKGWLDRAVQTVAGDAPAAPPGATQDTLGSLAEEAPGAAIRGAGRLGGSIASNHPLKSLGALGGATALHAHAHARDTLSRLEAGIKALGDQANVANEPFGDLATFARSVSNKPLRGAAQIHLRRNSMPGLARAMQAGEDSLRGSNWTSRAGGAAGFGKRLGLLALLGTLGAGAGY